MPDKIRKFVVFYSFYEVWAQYFSNLIIWLFCFKKKMGYHPFKIQSASILNLPKHEKSISHIEYTVSVWGCHSQNFDNYKFNAFTIKFTRLIFKTFKGVVFASIVFDIYLQFNDVIKETQFLVFEKGADLH